MEALAFLMPLATVVIALVALFTGMGWIFNWQLEPVKENQRELKAEQKELKAEQKELKAEQKELNSRMGRIEEKLDKLIERQA